MSRVRKVSFGIALSPVARHALAVARAADREDLPESYRAVVEASVALADEVREEARAVLDTLSALEDNDCASLDEGQESALFDDDDEDDDTDTWIPHGWVVSGVDLKDLFSDNEAHARDLYDLVRRLETPGTFYAYSVKLGTSLGELSELRDILEDYARTFRVALDPSQRIDADFGDEAHEPPFVAEPERPREPPREAPSPGGERRKATKGGAKWAKAEGFFGGLNDDEQGPPQTNAPPRPEGRLTEHEEFFLMRASLTWPADQLRLEAAWRSVVLREHPDKNPGDHGAHHRFVLLKNGFEALRKRIGP